VSNLVIGLLSALLATNQHAAVSNLVYKKTGVTVNLPDPNDPLEREFQKLLADDNAAQEEVDKWIVDNQKFSAQGAGISEATLRARIEQRFAPVKKAYEDFLQRHPKHERALVAYGSFLGDIGDEHDSAEQWEKARAVDPRDPAIWNNLANYYGHRGPVEKAFEYYEKAIELNPNEPVYYQNLGTTVFLFRVDAKKYYHVEEQGVFDRALELYAKALKLDPNNLELATDVAQTYYGIKPPRVEAALAAWHYALKIADEENEREKVYLHLARVQLNSGRFEEARANLNLVTNMADGQLKTLKERLTRNLLKKEGEAKEKTGLAPSESNQPKDGLKSQ
jgi:tetratricopeptide (TPR) repeat protein